MAAAMGASCRRSLARRVPFSPALIQCNCRPRKRLARCGAAATWRGYGAACGGGATLVSGLDARGRGGQLQLERELRPAIWMRRDLEPRAHRVDELVADGEPESRARKILSLCGRRPERLAQLPELFGVEAGPGVADGELDARVADFAGGDLDESLFGELQGVRGQVEQHPRHGAGVADALLQLRREESQVE